MRKTPDLFDNYSLSIPHIVQLTQVMLLNKSYAFCAENQSLGSADTNILENLLIEHPSMSVYQLRRDQEDLGSDEETEDMARYIYIQLQLFTEYHF